MRLSLGRNGSKLTPNGGPAGPLRAAAFPSTGPNTQPSACRTGVGHLLAREYSDLSFRPELAHHDDWPFAGLAQAIAPDPEVPAHFLDYGEIGFARLLVRIAAFLRPEGGFFSGRKHSDMGEALSFLRVRESWPDGEQDPHQRAVGNKRHFITLQPGNETLDGSRRATSLLVTLARPHPSILQAHDHSTVGAHASFPVLRSFSHSSLSSHVCLQALTKRSSSELQKALQQPLPVSSPSNMFFGSQGSPSERQRTLTKQRLSHQFIPTVLSVSIPSNCTTFARSVRRPVHLRQDAGHRFDNLGPAQPVAHDDVLTALNRVSPGEFWPSVVRVPPPATSRRSSEHGGRCSIPGPRRGSIQSGEWPQAPIPAASHSNSTHRRGFVRRSIRSGVRSLLSSVPRD